MIAQSHIDDRGLLTWDGEPLYSPETVKEAQAAGMPLFNPEAFEQVRGQLPIEEEEL